MFFIILVYGAALALEMLGSFISVVGLSAKTSHIIIFLIISLDFSKVMIATVLYKKWKDIHLLLRSFLIPALIFLIGVTSSGTYAFLIQEFSKTTAGVEQLQTKVDAMIAEKEKLEARKQVIDQQIAQLPPDSVVQRKRLTELFAKESDYINNRTQELDQQIPAAKVQAMQDTTSEGTLGSIAKAYGTTPEKISRIIAFFLVIVIDPLAIVLLTVANFLTEQRRKQQILAITDPQAAIALKPSLWKNYTKNIIATPAGTNSNINDANNNLPQIVKAHYDKNVQTADEMTILNTTVSQSWAHARQKLTPRYIIEKATLSPILKYDLNVVKTQLQSTNILETTKPLEPLFNRDTLALASHDFIQSVNAYQPVPEFILPEKELALELAQIEVVGTYVAPAPVIRKEQISLSPLSFITESNLEESPVVFASLDKHQSNTIEALPALQNSPEPVLNKESLALPVQDIIEQISLELTLPTVNLEKTTQTEVHTQTIIQDFMPGFTRHTEAISTDNVIVHAELNDAIEETPEISGISEVSPEQAEVTSVQKETNTKENNTSVVADEATLAKSDDNTQNNDITLIEGFHLEKEIADEMDVIAHDHPHADAFDITDIEEEVHHDDTDNPEAYIYRENQPVVHDEYENTEVSNFYSDSEEPTNSDTLAEEDTQMAHPKPNSKSMLNKLAKTDSSDFFNIKETPKFVPSNYPELPMDYADEMAWDDTATYTDYFNEGMSIDTDSKELQEKEHAQDEVLVKGFTTMELLEEGVF